MALYGKIGSKDTKKWNIDRNRMIFSLKENKSTSKGDSTTRLELEAKPIPEKRGDDGQVPIGLPPQRRKNLDRLRTYFMSEIVANIPDKVSLLKTINDMSTGEQVYDEGLLDYIKKNQTSLYDIIEEWNEVIERRNPKLLEKIIKSSAQLKGEKESEEYRKKSLAVQMNEPEAKRIAFRVAKYNLFIAVLEELMKSENNKHQILGGFFKLSKKKRTRSKRRTRRHE
jgi:hypothetical protein